MVKILNPSAKNEDGGNNKKNKKKKNSQLRPDSVAMKKVKASKSNPFETIWSRRKFDVLGKKRKGEERRLGLARSLAIQKAFIFLSLLNLLCCDNLSLSLFHKESLNLQTLMIYFCFYLKFIEGLV